MRIVHPGPTVVPDRRPGTPIAPPALLRRLNGVTVTGRVVNALTGQPLSGAVIRARSHDSRNGKSVLGEAVTQSAGAFQIRFRDDPRVLERLRLVGLSEASLTLEVEWARDGIAVARCPITGSTASPVTIPVTLPYQPVDVGMWETIGERAEDHRIGSIDALARELAAPASASLFGDLAFEVRHAALLDLEYAFLDPVGVLRRTAPMPTFYGLQAPGAMDELERAILQSTERSVA